ncbi:flagellar hook-length control protein FliK [Pseudocolwellia agarivorans]|uniref:flagellar hook-length control protein FliK n=1 Tax=Pseudocolwellia agarivorans TaxID=1911682 RepID=UPI000985605E|nr:flagellar hook-length control protein FliK [Pseudocolwellia agarivorans]
MSNMTLLTLESTQPIDTKALSGGFDDSSKESSLLFSDVMEKHKGQAQSGNSVTTNGKKEQQLYANENIHKENELNEYENQNQTEELETQNNNHADAELSTKTNNEAQDTTLSEADAAESIDPKSIPSTKEQTTNQPEQLLSFLNASEKVLVTSNNTVASSSEKNAGEEASKIVETNKAVNSANTFNKVVGDSSETLIEKESAGALKTDKTLIAQSVSNQIDTEDSDILQKVKALLQSKETESTNTSVKNIVETPVKNNADKSTAKVLSNDSAEATDDEMLIKAGAVATQPQGIPTTLDAKKTNRKLENIPDNKTGTVNHITNTKSEALEEVIEQSTDILSDTEKTSIKTEQVIAQSNAQSKFQTLSKDVSKIDQSVNESKNINATGELSEEAIDNESFDESITRKLNNVTNEKHNDVKNIIGEKNQIEQNKSIAQSPVATKEFESKAETAAESTEESVDIVIEEIMHNEAKTLNSHAKLNQGVNPLFDTLSQRDVKHLTQGEERFIEHELSFENTMQNISADLAQTQKSAVIQQIETISIMRKDFTDAVKEKVMVMINQKIQQVDIQLDPPELGRMQVRINLQNEQAVVNFVVQNQQAKEALEQNMDKLKHMMSESGVDVGGANVKQQSNQSSAQEQNNQGSNGQFEQHEDGATEQSITAQQSKVIKASSTGVDYYA